MTCLLYSGGNAVFALFGIFRGKGASLMRARNMEELIQKKF